MSTTSLEQGSELVALGSTRFSRLLLVDDNESLLVTLTQIFENEGFTVIGCATAEKALQHIHDQDFDVAVVDLKLPDMKGTQLLEEFNRLGSRVRVIVNTGYGALDSAKDAINLGAFAYLEKTGDPIDLIQYVHRARRSHFETYADNLEAAVAERTAKLSESEKRLRLVFENAPVSLWHEDFSAVKQRIDSIRQGGIEDFRIYFEDHPDEVANCGQLVKILDVNRAAIKLHHAESMNQLADLIMIIFSEESSGVFQEELIALANGATSFESDAVVTTLEGEQIDVLLRVFVDPDSQNWSSVYVAITDVAEQKRLEKELLEYHQLLEQRVRERTTELTDLNAQLQLQIEERQQLEKSLVLSQRLSSLGTLVAGVAHEINNPIGSAKLAAETALASWNDAAGGDRVEKCLNNIVACLDRCGRTVRDLLAFAGDEPTEKKLQDIREVILRSCDRTRTFADRKNVEVQLSFESNLPTIAILRLDMEMAIANLLQNAIDASESSGEIVVAAKFEDAAIQISIKDKGCGITSEQKELLFDPFYTTRQGEGGVGMGLSITYGIVRAHGGTIEVVSTPGLGTTITVALPLPESLGAEHEFIKGERSLKQ